jgi:hypothetical protein
LLFGQVPFLRENYVATTYLRVALGNDKLTALTAENSSSDPNIMIRLVNIGLKMGGKLMVGIHILIPMQQHGA